MKGLPVKLDISLALVSWFIQNLELPVKFDNNLALVSCVIQKNVLKTSNLFWISSITDTKIPSPTFHHPYANSSSACADGNHLFAKIQFSAE